TRQQYSPGAAVSAPPVAAELAWPSLSVTPGPTAVPLPVGQPDPVTAPGAHRTKETLPLGTGLPLPPERIATSSSGVPATTDSPPGVADVTIEGSTPTQKWRSAEMPSPSSSRSFAVNV